MAEFAKIKPRAKKAAEGSSGSIAVMADVGDKAALPAVLAAAKDGALACSAWPRFAPWPGSATPRPCRCLLETIAQAQDELAEVARDSLVELERARDRRRDRPALDRTDWKVARSSSSSWPAIAASSWRPPPC